VQLPPEAAQVLVDEFCCQLLRLRFKLKQIGGVAAVLQFDRKIRLK
jgi:hypothetical protein